MPRLTKIQREMNVERVDRAHTIVESYKSRVCDTIPQAVGDVLADMMHFCKCYKIDFEDQLKRARSDFWCEQNGVD